MPRRLLLVGLGAMGTPYLEAAHRLGLDVTVVDRPHRLDAAEVRRRLGRRDRAVPFAGRGDGGWYAAAAAAADTAPIDAVLAFSEPHVLAAALVADEAGLPGPGLRAAVVSRDKSLQRAAFARHRIAQPDYALVSSADEAEAWARGRDAVVVKPVGEFGSVGVVIADAPESLRAACEQRSETFLVEEFVSGPEFSCETLVVDGRVVYTSVTGKVTTEPPFAVELEHHVPGSLEGRDESLLALAQSVVDAVGVRTSIMHLEFRLAAGGPVVMEIAVRTPGDHIPELVELATGADLFEAVIAAAAGDRPRPAPTRAGYACAWFPQPSPGTVVAVDGADEVAAQEGVVAVHTRPAIGTRASQFRSSLDRIGGVLIQAPSREELDRRLCRARATLRVRTRP